jgi:hypothetical protein
MMAAAKSRSILGDGRVHGLGGGSAAVVTSTPRRGEHAFDATGLCACGCRRKLAAGEVLYQGKHGGGWTRARPPCSAVWQ